VESYYLRFVPKSGFRIGCLGSQVTLLQKNIIDIKVFVENSQNLMSIG